MKTIWKFTLEIGSDAPISMPQGARIVHFAKQGDAYGLIHVWAEVNPEAEMKPRHLSIHGTGHPIPDDTAYLASCLNGPFVWHLYERAT